VRDPIAGIGGLNHFMLPGTMRDYDPASSDTRSSYANRYGQHAMDNLLEDLCIQGCKADNFEIKLFGGGHVIG
ncbi:MAG: chemoreceptor glutamine deamidase CheD, partial [Granulosicoccaceae bacterium]